MKNYVQDIIISVLVVIICFIITVVTGASFFWLLLPIVFTILLAFLGKLLREKYGSSYGITTYLFLFFAVPLLWYVFCSQMPITALTLKTQQKVEDFSSFKKYEGDIDAKQQFVDYQVRQDSILKDAVAKLLSENKVDSALSLIESSKKNAEMIKEKLFSLSNEEIPNGEVTKGQIVEPSKAGTSQTIWFNPKQKVRSTIYLHRYQKYRIFASADCFVNSYKGLYIPEKQSREYQQGTDGYINIIGAEFDKGYALIEVLTNSTFK